MFLTADFQPWFPTYRERMIHMRNFEKQRISIQNIRDSYENEMLKAHNKKYQESYPKPLPPISHSPRPLCHISFVPSKKFPEVSRPQKLNFLPTSAVTYNQLCVFLAAQFFLFFLIREFKF